MIKKIVKTSALFILTSSLVLPVFSNAAEDVVISGVDAATILHTRVLAASCAACHGTNGNAVTGSTVERNAVLAGKDRTDFTFKMLGFRDGSRKSTVMHHHAKGLTEFELSQLAKYFSEQKPNIATPLKPQALKASHE